MTYQDFKAGRKSGKWNGPSWNFATIAKDSGLSVETVTRYLAAEDPNSVVKLDANGVQIPYVPVPSPAASIIGQSVEIQILSLLQVISNKLDLLTALVAPKK